MRDRPRHSAAPWRMARLLAGLLAVASLGAAQDTRTFTGTVSDELCAVSGHASMQMGPTDGDCARACADAHDAAFVLVDDDTVYALSDQKLAGTFAGAKVRVVGTLDAATRTIRVSAITAQ